MIDSELSLFLRFAPVAVFVAFFTSFALSFRSRAALQLEILALRHQLGVLQRSVKRPNLTSSDRLLWVWLCRIWPDWRSALIIVQPPPSSRGIARAFDYFGSGRFVADGVDGHRFRRTCAR